MRDHQPLTALLGFALLTAFAVVGDPRGTEWRLVGLAGLVLGATALLLLRPLGPAREDVRAPAWTALATAVAALLAIALLRQSQGGSTSGYSPLGILVVAWVAVVLDRRAVIVVTACCWLMFAVPLALIGPPLYPSSGWRGAVLWTLVAYLVGVLVNSTLAVQRAHAADAERHALEVEQVHVAFAAVMRVARDVSLGTDARQLVCSAVLASTDAAFATVSERVGDRVAITGSAGIAVGAEDLRGVQPMASRETFTTGRRIFVPDVNVDPRVSPVIVRATGIRSALFEPILRGGRPVGVLSMAWGHEVQVLDAKTGAIVEFLAAEAAAAIERADLLAQLDSQARSDELTALPNRRAWDEALATALGREAPMYVAMVDIDHFKRFNDTHGHAVGDRLLRACALAWKSHLRAGDVLARYGGEEFAVLLPGCGLRDATTLLETLRRATPQGVTASIGVAERLANDDESTIMARADAALYRAKDTGRDQLRAA